MVLNETLTKEINMRNILVRVQDVLPGDNWTSPDDYTYVIYNNLANAEFSRRLLMIGVNRVGRTHATELTMFNEATLVLDRPE